MALSFSNFLWRYVTYFSFSSCYFFVTVRNGDQTVLGRIVVKDRIQVEANVLPRYFNHSSFASLRRQLNYFSFVRLGKGRQRESTYRNEAVIELDDILTLKRRPAGSTPTNLVNPTTFSTLSTSGLASMSSSPSKNVVAQSPSDESKVLTVATNTTPMIGEGSTIVPIDNSDPILHQKKRRRLSNIRRGSSPSLVSDFGIEKIHHRVSLDLTKPEVSTPLAKPCIPDDDVLAGCTALLGLSNGW